MRTALRVARKRQRIFILPKKHSQTFRVYEILFDNNQTKKEMGVKVQVLGTKLFCDTVVETSCTQYASRSTHHAYIVWFKPGVYDAEGEMALYCAQKLGLSNGIKKIKFGRGYKLVPRHAYSVKQLFNPLVEYLEKL